MAGVECKVELNGGLMRFPLVEIRAQVRYGRAMQRLGRNKAGYFGEQIEIGAVIRDCLAAAHQHGWRIQSIEAAPGLSLPTMHRPARASGQHSPARRIYLSAGIHGDEPASPMASRQLLQENRWPDNAELWFCPCLNPTGYPLNKRENAAGKDLNRDYLHLETPEIRAHIEWLKQQPAFDLCLCLHEDWESHGFYVYELNPDGQPSLAEPMVAAVSQVCPIDMSEEIEERPAKGGIIRPSIDPRSRPQWPEAFWLLTHKTRLSYTLEAPSDWPLAVRTAALVEGVRAAANGFTGRAQNSIG